MVQTFKLRGGLTEKLEQNAGKVRFRRWKNMTVGARVSLILLAAVILMAILAPAIAPYDPLATDFTPRQAPSGENLFGTDNKGRDILSRVMYGAQYSLVIGLGATSFALVMGSIIGSIAAVSRKWVSEVIMRVLDVIMSFPGIALAATFVVMFGRNLPTLIFAIGCAGILSQFADELGMLIYKSADAGQFIRVMAPLVPVMYFDHAVDAMLKGLGEQVYSMKVNILDAALCAALVWLLCPRIGIWGYVVTIYIAEVVNASLSLWRLAKVTQFAAGISRSLVRPLAGAAGALALTRLCGFAVCAGWGQLLLGCIFSAAVYFMLLVLLGAVTRRDLAWAAGVFR